MLQMPVFSETDVDSHVRRVAFGIRMFVCKGRMNENENVNVNENENENEKDEKEKEKFPSSEL